MPRILIVGIGNPTRSDDGVGLHVARELAKENLPSDVQIVATPQLTPEIAERVSKVDKVVFIDAARSGEPGSISWREITPEAAGRNDRDAGNTLGHKWTPVAVMKLANELYGICPQAYLLTISGETFEIGDTMSRAVASAVPAALIEIKKFIADS